jgi:hypothetical protein
MSHVHQIAPFPHQVEPIELPDDGALLIETTGFEILEEWPRRNVTARVSSNDNAARDTEIAENVGEIVSFVATLPRVG